MAEHIIIHLYDILRLFLAGDQVNSNHKFSSNSCAKSRLSLYMVVRPQCMAYSAYMEATEEVQINANQSRIIYTHKNKTTIYVSLAKTETTHTIKPHDSMHAQQKLKSCHYKNTCSTNI